jgi:hypothetical protein
MSIKLSCRCGKRLLAKSEHCGKRVKCPKCGQHLLVPAEVEQPLRRYYLAIGAQRLGPFEKDELVEHGLQGDSLVWSQGMTAWEHAHKVNELKALFAKQQPDAPLEPPPLPRASSNGVSSAEFEVADVSAEEATDNRSGSYCRQCGKPNLKTARFCAACGDPFQPLGKVESASTDRKALIYPRNPPLSPHLAWLNLALTGIAQIVHGQVAKGILLAIATFTLAVIIPFVGGLAVCILSIIDAYMVGRALRAGRTLRKWQWFPSAS